MRFFDRSFRRGDVAAPRSGGRRGVDWEAAREEHGVGPNEKLYAGFASRRPGIYVAPHLEIRAAGTPVWVDGRQLARRLHPRGDGGVETDDEARRRARARLLERGGVEDSISGEEVDLAGDPRTLEAMVGFLLPPPSIYFRQYPEEEEALALNILFDLLGEAPARRLYGPGDGEAGTGGKLNRFSIRLGSGP